MRKANFLLIFIFLIFTLPLFAKGNKDETETKTQNDEWFFCITKFDTSDLPANKTNISDMVSRELVDRLRAISYRTRISPEYAFYEEYAWARNRANVAKSISAKMDERSKLIYQGEVNWKYYQAVKKIDIDLIKLNEELEEIDKNAPLINKEPVFKIFQSNLDLSYPDPPQKGGENRFCNAQKIDAFLSGKITDFYGRYSLVLRLYTVYTKSFVWEENYIFSYNDINSTIDEITRKLMITLSGSNPSAVAIKTEPDTALVLINQNFAGKGGTKLTEYPPGNITVTVSAPDHETLVMETELLSGELTQIDIKLYPRKYVNTEIISKTQGHVYNGSLYVGESPLTLRLPANNFEYIEMESPSAKKGSVVFKTSGNIEETRVISLKLSQPNKKGAVDRERRGYYWAWGGQWITGIALWLGYYSFMGANNAAIYGRNNDYNVTQDFVNNNKNLYNFTMYAAIGFGVTTVYGIIRMFRYIYISGRDSTPIVNTSRTK